MMVLLSSGMVIAASGCATTKRVLTNTLWKDDNGSHTVYLSYWEGNCLPKIFGGCSLGDSHVKSCTSKGDNKMMCEDNAELDKMIAR
jgi:hypothetical protein